MRPACNRFAEQCRKAGLSPHVVREARLEIRKLPGIAEGLVNGRMRPGFTIAFTATAVLDTARTARCQVTRFVAPHDPNTEMQARIT